MKLIHEVNWAIQGAPKISPLLMKCPPLRLVRSAPTINLLEPSPLFFNLEHHNYLTQLTF